MYNQPDIMYHGVQIDKELVYRVDYPLNNM